jgi:glucan biosynthesis protein C
MISSEQLTECPGTKPVRPHYLDWLQVIAFLGVFLFHAVHPFDTLMDWTIKNAETTPVLNLLGGFLFPWGMSFLFLVSGAIAWFSLQRRTPLGYVVDCVRRLLVPFVVGTVVLSPIQTYYGLTHKGAWQGGSLVQFLFSSKARTYFGRRLSTSIGPEIFNRLGYHLWFLGFLFVFALSTLPVFVALKQETGRRLVAWLAWLVRRRGGLLIFVVPLVMVRFLLQRGKPSDPYGWADFCYRLLFFVSGYVLIADERFLRAIRRDCWMHLIVAVLCSLFLLSMAAGVPVYEWLGSPSTSGFYVSWIVWCLYGWCWTMVALYVGMRYLDRSNRWLQYSREASYPFFVFHQPAIISVAFFVVQWNTSNVLGVGVGLVVKLLAVVFGSFCLSLGLYELFVRRVDLVRFLFGMKVQGAVGSGRSDRWEHARWRAWLSLRGIALNHGSGDPQVALRKGQTETGILETVRARPRSTTRGKTNSAEEAVDGQ